MNKLAKDIIEVKIPIIGVNIIEIIIEIIDINIIIGI